MFGAAVLVPTFAHAQSTNQSLAESLFEQAMRLMAQQRYSEACPKLAESQRLDPGGGTLINLGLCREKEGKFASAWSAFSEALGLALKDGRKDRESIAREHLATIEPQLIRLVVSVAKETAALEGLEVKLDGSEVRQAAWDVATPVDTGPHWISATAPHKVAWKSEVNVTTQTPTVTLAVPPLEDAPVAATPGSPGGVTPPPIAEHTASPAPWIVGGIGVASLLVGGIGGILAIVKHGEVTSSCGDATRCTKAAVDAESAANAWGWVANIGLAVGVVGVGVATVLFLTSGSNKPASTQAFVVAPWVGPGGGGLGASGSF
ncbi:hypothetical protein BH09MYX1_BH09MYX1_47580 [soil metagenome]